MSLIKGRPLGVTVLSLVVMFQGVVGILVGLNLVGVLEILNVPSGGSASSSGAALIIAGIVSTIFGLGLMTMKFWAYVAALFVLGLTVLAGVIALIQHGINADNGPSLVPAVISAIIFAYMFSERVRPYYDAD